MIFAIDDQARAGRAALIDATSGESWTWKRLADEVNRRSEALAFPRKALVFQFCRNTLSAVAWYLGAMEAGHVVALLAEILDPRARSALLTAFDPEFVLLPGEPGGSYTAQPWAGLWSAAQPGEWPAIHPELSLLLSTSGSTGSPKMARLSRASVGANAKSIASALDLRPEDRPIAHLPMHYSYGLSVLNSHLMTGSTTVLTAGSVIEADFWRSVSAHRCTSFAGVPYTYQVLRRLGFESLPAAQTITSMTQAGGKLDDRSIRLFHAAMSARNGQFWVMYGQTEATARIAILPASRLADKLGSAGCAIPGGSFAIETEQGLTVEPGIVGELVYSGPNVMLGYGFSRADLAEGDERCGRLHTGDRARLDGDGYVYILGRTGRDTKVLGLRINMDEVEAMVRTHGPAAVVGGVDRLIVYCEFGTREELRRLQADLSARLNIHGSVLDFRPVEKLPTNSAGKIDYSRLEVS